ARDKAASTLPHSRVAQSAAWIIFIWGVLPAFLAMHGVAMLRVAELIIEKHHSNNAHSMLQIA
ncbi:MAG: hypothetical protein ACPGK3_08965, partial [Paracoccaceae bacterium]